MTKRETITRATWRLFAVVAILATVVIVLHVVAQSVGVHSNAFWLSLYVFGGILALGAFAAFLGTVRCPDCRRALMYSSVDWKLMKCPHCGADWSVEISEK